MCFVDIEKAFDKSFRKGDGMDDQKKGLPEVIVRAVMSLYHGEKTKVRVGSELSEDFLEQFGAHKGSVWLPLLFAIAVDVISENAREELMNEILYAEDLISLEKFLKWKEALQGRGGR